MPPPLMNPTTASSELPAHWHRRHFDEVTSTMQLLHTDRLADGEVQLVTADFQTRGHGQVNTVWESARARNLTFSFAFRPRHVAATEQFLLSEIACLAVAHTLDAYTEGISVKWPNDVYHRDRKICGMLLTHTLHGAQIADTLVGIGLNLNQKRFEGDAPNPVSLRQIIGRSAASTCSCSASRSLTPKADLPGVERCTANT